MATTTKGIPYPVGSDPNDAPADMQAIADWLDDALGAKTTAQISALSGAALWTGRTVLDSDTGDVKVYRGATLGWVVAGGVVGGIVWMADTTDPPGHLYADGSSVSTTTYAALFAKLSYDFGGSGGSFNLPNLRNRLVAGLGTEAEFNVLGETGGSKTVTISTSNMPSHTHTGPSHTHGIDHNHPAANTATDGSHIHAYQRETSTLSNRNDPGTGGGLDLVAFPTTVNTVSGGAHNHSFNMPNFTGTSASGGTANTGSSGSGSSLNVQNPYIVLKPYIKF